MYETIMSSILSYKKSVAIFAAYELGIFDIIENTGFIDMQVCIDNGWNKEYFKHLCAYFTGIEYFTYENGRWRFSERFSKDYISSVNVIKHENNLYSQWMSKEILINSISGNKRVFDTTGMNALQRNVYDNAVYGDNLSLAVLYLLRKLPIMDKALNCLEYSLSNGRLMNYLFKWSPDIKCEYIPFQLMHLSDTYQFNKDYDCIFILNVIHYLKSSELIKLLTYFKSILKRDGVICILDMYYHPDNIFQSTILLDWITHGGSYHICLDELKSLIDVNKLGFTENITIPAIFMDILFIHNNQ